MHQKLLALGICLSVFACADAGAQEQQVGEKSYNLRHSTLEEQQAAQAAEEVQQVDYEPIIDERTLETSLTLGFWMLDKTLLEHDNIIYKYTSEDTYFGDVVIKGQSAFNPQLRLNYNLYPWFSLEPVFGVSVSEYTATVANPRSLSNQATGSGGYTLEDVEGIGEYDAENRSIITLSTGLNAVFYPHDYGNFAKGRWHPYVQGGVTRTWLSINSDYTGDSADSWDLNGGGGIRLVADKLISIRFEVLFHHMTVEFEPKDSFRVMDEGETRIPVYEYIEGIGPQTVTGYTSQTLNTMSWALGFTANF
ncbi:MAG: hypothetical protein Q7W29_05340 [bacterium]|nr:hypothetical protein [bacterium]